MGSVWVLLLHLQCCIYMSILSPFLVRFTCGMCTSCVFNSGNVAGRTGKKIYKNWQHCQRQTGKLTNQSGKKPKFAVTLLWVCSRIRLYVKVTLKYTFALLLTWWTHSRFIRFDQIRPLITKRILQQWMRSCQSKESVRQQNANEVQYSRD